MKLKDLIEISDSEDRLNQIRKAFAAYSDGVEVEGFEYLTVVILLNLSAGNADLLNADSAKEALNDDEHIDSCLAEIKWFHTHNLKFPDARVSQQRVLVKPEFKSSSFFSSANLPLRFGWSHSAQYIRKAILFGASFLWRGNWFNLVELIAKDKATWIEAFNSLGLNQKQKKKIKLAFQESLSNTSFPGEVNSHSPQLLFPINGEYISMTPVVSHSVQAHLFSSSMRRSGKFIWLSYDHPANIGSLCASRGGNLSSLFYPPVPKASHKASKYKLRRHATNDLALRKNLFFYALDGLMASHNEISMQKRRKRRVLSLRYIRHVLIEWLSPVIEQLKSSENVLSLKSLSNSEFIKELIDADRKEKEEIIFLKLNQLLERNKRGIDYAYHPDLITPVGSQIKWIVNNIERILGKQDKVAAENEVYLHLTNLRMYDVNALANPYLCGTPSLTAVWGWAHNFQRKLNKLLPFQIEFESFSWFIHSYSLGKGQKLAPEENVQMGKPKRSGIIPSKECDLISDIILKVKVEPNNFLTSEYISYLMAAMPARFAGGSVHQPSLYEQMQWCFLYDGKEELFNNLFELSPYGRWIYPSLTKVKSLEDLIGKCTLQPTLKPAMTGYVLLEKPTERLGSIEDLHAYVEPVIGMLESVGMSEVILNGASSFYHRAFWKMKSSNDAILMGSFP